MASDLPAIIRVSELFQVGIVVRNLEDSMNTYQHLLGIDQWQTVEVDSASIPISCRGEPVDLSFKAAFCMLGSLMLELLEPVRGYGTYRQFLEAHGEGIHHLGHIRVENLDDAVKALEKAGFPCVESGGIPEAHAWAYVDTTPALGYIIELSSGIDPRDMMK